MLHCILQPLASREDAESQGHPQGPAQSTQWEERPGARTQGASEAPDPRVPDHQGHSLEQTTQVALPRRARLKAPRGKGQEAFQGEW